MQNTVRSAHQANDEIEHLKTHSDVCLVIDGESLQTCLDYFEKEFIDVATRLPVVVCCRCSPTQKVKRRKKTLVHIRVKPWFTK
jgi:phospholipid-translocating ATPase